MADRPAGEATTEKAMKRAARFPMTLAVSLFLLELSSCATSSAKLIDIHLGMTKGKVREAMGDPTVVRGSIRNKFQQTIYVWEYRLTLPSTDTPGEVIGKSAITILSFGMGAILFTGEEKDYWLYFLDDDLVQWGEAGDWSREPDRIYEFRFEPAPRIIN